MTLDEEIIWLRSEVQHERRKTSQARTVATDLASVLSGVMVDALPPDLSEVFEQWEKELEREARRNRGRR